ncbi:MAG: geranylgeranyl reductase family protein [Candidatus Portnoybacteria bacterium]|nr:geranylgeranyl reductase family protein [Candidatus Portnoybacteria bacterium]
MDKNYDIVIVGAGPAGSSLAFYLAQSKLKVALIDEEKFPRKKVCAGGLSNRVFSVLPFDISSIIECEISKITLAHGLKKEFTRSYDKRLVAMIKREKFDDFLVQKAKEAGAEFFDGQRIENIFFEKDNWQINTSTNFFQGKILVGADGADSFVAKNIGLNPIDFMGVAIQVEIPASLAKNYSALNAQTIFLDLGTIKHCYGWVFPKSDLFSIGVGGPITSGQQLKLYLFELLKYLGVKTDNLNLTGHLFNHRTSGKPITAKQALLVGEAAGLVDYWTGEGIFYAIKSAKIAAKQIKRFFEGHKKAIGDYETDINQQIMPELKASKKLSGILMPISSFVFNVLKNNDRSWNTFCRVIRGDKTFFELKKRLRPDVILKKLLFG